MTKRARIKVVPKNPYRFGFTYSSWRPAPTVSDLSKVNDLSLTHSSNSFQSLNTNNRTCGVGEWGRLSKIPIWSLVHMHGITDISVPEADEHAQAIILANWVPIANIAATSYQNSEYGMTSTESSTSEYFYRLMNSAMMLLRELFAIDAITWSNDKIVPGTWISQRGKIIYPRS